MHQDNVGFSGPAQGDLDMWTKSQITCKNDIHSQQLDVIVDFVTISLI